MILVKQMLMLGPKNSGVSNVIANSKRLFQIFCGMFSGLVFSASAVAESYEYVNPLNRREEISIQVTPPQFSGGDIATVAEFCKPAERYVCVSSARFNFAFPLARKADVLKWEYKGNSYELIGEEKLYILNYSLKVWIVESVQDDKKIRYAYSDYKGLMAFSVQFDEFSNTFLSRSKLGFGHQKKAKVNLYKRRDYGLPKSHLVR
jgi:hypothetical protein